MSVAEWESQHPKNNSKEMIASVFYSRWKDTLKVFVIGFRQQGIPS
jgi:hypothetical protein